MDTVISTMKGAKDMKRDDLFENDDRPPAEDHLDKYKFVGNSS